MQEFIKWLRWSEEREEEQKLLTISKDFKSVGSSMLQKAIERAKAGKVNTELAKKIRVCEETRKDRQLARMTRNCQPRPKTSLINEYDEVVGDANWFLRSLLREKAEHDRRKAIRLQMLSKKMR